ncbi:MAG: hypothetical protein JSS02_33980 [Planctomycetes bacterium]|nr:hypothetical protein [Planctomycetota bacterium]
MSARFAGSQRVGDRRRRRLAVEAEGTTAEDAPRHALPAPAGVKRMLDMPNTSAPCQVTENSSNPPELPINQVVPLERWKYSIAGVAVLAVNGSLVALGQLSRKLAAWAGPQFAELFAPASGPATKWFSGILVGLAAQLSLLIWWGRSRSTKDFDGRYWLWTQTAIAWFLLSGCLALNGGQVAADVLKTIQPTIPTTWLPLAWIVPALVAGLFVERGLRREMRGCRASRVLMIGAWLSYLATAAIDLGAAASISPRAQLQLQQIALLTGHAALFFSMWVHARHVFHVSPDPVVIPVRTWKIPRPQLRLPRIWPFVRRTSAVAVLGAATPETEATFEIPKSRQAKRRETSQREPSLPEAPAAETPVKSTPTPIPAAPAEIDELAELERMADEDAQHAADQAAHTAPAAESIVPKSHFRIDSRHEPMELEDVSQAQHEASQKSSDNSDYEGEDDDDSSGRADLKGLSKKQRRRLIQEQRARERANRGQ